MRKTWLETVVEVQAVPDAYLLAYDTKRHHQGRGIKGRTPVVDFGDGLPRQTKQDTSAAAPSTKKRKEKMHQVRSA